MLRNYNPNQFLWKRKTIEENVGITIPPNKRNGRTQKEHIDYMNFSRNQKIKNGSCKMGETKSKNVMNKIFNYIVSCENKEQEKIKNIMLNCNVSKPTAIKYKNLWYNKYIKK